MIYNNILEAIGHTPLIKLNHMVKEGSADILVKFMHLLANGRSASFPNAKTRTPGQASAHSSKATGTPRRATLPKRRVP